MKSISKFLSALLVFSVCCANAQKKTADKRLAGIDTALNRVLKTWNVPGVAVAVVEKNRVIYAKGFGYSNVEMKKAVTPQTIFAIGSCTKAFTASIIGMLEKDGKLDIDKPAHLYLDELNFQTADLTNAVTLRDMMSHRTGLPRHDFSWYLFGSGNRDSLVKRIQYQEPTFPLRRQWQYNNFMYVAQGAMIEKLTGNSWEDNVRSRIFQPIGMTHSGFTPVGNSDASLGYILLRDSVVSKIDYFNIAGAGPAGSINSSAMDMTHWLMTWINGGKYEGKQVLPEDFMREAISPQSVIGAGLPSKEKPDVFFANYGFGWMLSSYRGHYRVEHGGNIDGFTASTCFFPTDSIGIVVFANQDGSSAPAIIRNIIADRLLKQPYRNWNDDLWKTYIDSKMKVKEAMATRTSGQKTGTHPSHPLPAYEGLYTQQGYGTMDVFSRNDSLFANTPTKLLWLKHYHYDIFEPVPIGDPRFSDEEENNFRLRFNTGYNGDIESLNAEGFESVPTPLVFTRTERTRTMDSADLKKYEGVYVISGEEIKIYVANGKLKMFVPGQPEYELSAAGNDKFVLASIQGYAVQFLKDKNNSITAIDLVQPNGTFKAERKQ